MPGSWSGPEGQYRASEVGVGPILSGHQGPLGLSGSGLLQNFMTQIDRCLPRGLVTIAAGIY